MTLALMVAGRQSGTFGTFEVEDGNVSKNRRLVLSYFNETTALVPMDARLTFTTGEEHSAFDATLMALATTGVAIQYVDSIANFMNPKARFSEWLDGKATILPDLTPEELAVPSAYESAKAKFVAMFTPPKPVLSAGGVDLSFLTQHQAARVDSWRKDKAMGLTGDIQRELARDARNRTLLRIISTSDTAYKVENSNGHSMTRTKFFEAYNEHIKPIWDRTPSNGEIGRLGSFYTMAKEAGYGSARDRSVTVYNNYVEIGCQAIPRAEVERIVTEFEKIGIIK